MDAGKLDRLIDIQIRESIKDDYGASIPAWILHAKVWASKRDVRGREFWESDKVQSETTTRFVVRYRSDLDVSMRVLYDSKAYRINGLKELGRRAYLEIMASVDEDL